jgi:hypothetical protein
LKQVTDQILDEVSKFPIGGSEHLEVTVDNNDVASHSASEIIAHIDSGGSVVLKTPGDVTRGYAQLFAVMGGSVIFTDVLTNSGDVTQSFYGIDEDKLVTTSQNIFSGGSIPEDKLEQIQENTDAIEEMKKPVTLIDFSNFDNGSFTETINGEVITHTVTFDSQGRPSAIDDTAIVWGDS